MIGICKLGITIYTQPPRAGVGNVTFQGNDATWQGLEVTWQLGA